MTPHSILFIIISSLIYTNALNLNYLDPIKLQTKTSAEIQQNEAYQIISKYLPTAIVEVDPKLFRDNKDVFALRTVEGRLHIRASTGIAAVWGFNYYLKKYCKSQIAWQVKHVAIPSPLPEVDEVVVANDRFRYYQNVCTVSYSFVWWNVIQWQDHVEWMALNGLNLVLAPVAQEAAWSRIYKQVGMTQDEIDEHFTGPAFLSWLRMGNVRGWGGPLPQSWHNLQVIIQRRIVDYMFRLGIVPVFPAFNGHVPTPFARIFTNTTFYRLDSWNRFESDYCCDLFIEPSDPLFVKIGAMFLKEITTESTMLGHLYSSDPFNELHVPEDTRGNLILNTGRAIYATLKQVDGDAVWLIQNWMFVNNPSMWTSETVKTFLTSVPNGRMLVLDLQAEQEPKYGIFNMYYGQPFIWCMLHNFGGTSGMFGRMPTINRDVYKARSSVNSTMIGIGLTPEGINQNYVVYDLMLESAWRKNPVPDLDSWVADYAERRYGCNATAAAWSYLLKSVYNYTCEFANYNQYIVTMRPSLGLKAWAWYSSKDLFKAFKKLVLVSQEECFSPGFYYDVVDVTRQALQYRAEQLYSFFVPLYYANDCTFADYAEQFLEVLGDMEYILSLHKNFTAEAWLKGARNLGQNEGERFLYELNARNQITLWGPNGEISDYACKQWAETFRHYYIPRWTKFLSAAKDAREKKEYFEEETIRRALKIGVERKFLSVPIEFDQGPVRPDLDIKTVALDLYKKWAFVDLPDLDIIH